VGLLKITTIIERRTIMGLFDALFAAGMLTTAYLLLFTAAR
jgi:hypothetical protein